MRIRKIMAMILSCTMLFAVPSWVSADPDEMIVQTAPLEGESVTENTADNSIVVSSGSDIVKLKSNIREVDSEDILSWAVDAGITRNMTKEQLQSPCSWQQFLSFLWRANGAPVTASAQLMKTDEEKEQENIYTWAVKSGLLSEQGGKEQLLYTMMFGNAEWALWHIAGEPTPSSSQHDLPLGDHEDAELWACDTGLIIKEEQPLSDPTEQMKTDDALKYIYYSYNRRSESSFPITLEQFMASCQHVVDMARTNGYIYGSSSAVNPTTDGIISCDRLVAKALYDLGYTDQPRGGLVCSNIDQYLGAWGFERSTSLSAAKRGSIMLVKHRGKDHTSHVFVCASDFNWSNMTCDRYDCGSNGLIRAVQPVRNLTFVYRTDDVIVYNIPE